MKIQRLTTFSLCAIALSICLASAAPAALIETWESQPATNPFTGAGDLTWTGDLSAWAITTATWPVAPAQDFAGSRSLRSTNHGSVVGTTTVETVVTNISSEVNFAQPMEWSVFVSGNSASIQPSRRADFFCCRTCRTLASLKTPTRQ